MPRTVPFLQGIGDDGDTGVAISYEFNLMVGLACLCACCTFTIVKHRYTLPPKNLPKINTRVHYIWLRKIIYLGVAYQFVEKMYLESWNSKCGLHVKQLSFNKKIN